MTTETPNINPQGTVSFSRKVSVRQYESAEASIFVQFDIPTDGTPDEQRTQLIANARAAFFAAKALVFEELGLEFSVSDSGVIHEVVQKNFGRVTEVVNEPNPFPSAPQQVAITESPAPAGEVGANPPYAADTQDKQERIENKKWAVARIATNPDEWWDNRNSKRNPKAPDYKHKQNGMGVWL
jgi:hypothetical protein